MHPDQLEIPVATVRRLVDEQFPEWAALPIRAVSSTGTVNALFRIGDRLSARLPLQRIDIAEARRWLTEEADAARELHRRTPFATPEPVAIGEPGPGYPLPWAVQTWVPGTPAFDDDRANRSASPPTWPPSSAASGPSTPGAAASPAPAAAATSAATTRGWRTASAAARAWSTSGGCASCGPS